MSAEVTEPNNWSFSPARRVKLQADPLELLGQQLGVGLLLDAAAHGGGLHLLDDGLVGRTGFNGELAGQQIVASVPFGDLHHIAAGAQLRRHLLSE